MPATTRRIETAGDATPLLRADRFSPASRRALSGPWHPDIRRHL